MTVTYVEDAELLYRAIRAGSDEYRIENGRLLFATNAFNDSENKPSVDRSSMRVDPRDARLTSTDGVTTLETKAVRAIATVRATPQGQIHAIEYKVDVKHRPIVKSASQPLDNAAHCRIECAPEIKRSHYKKLKEALARLATEHGWTVPPQ